MKKPISFPHDPSADPVSLAAAAVQSLIHLFVVDCNRNGSGLQSAPFPDHIICIYPTPQDRIICD